MEILPDIRGLTEESTKLGIIFPQLSILKPRLGIFSQLGISDLFSDSALLDSYIPNPQLAILTPIGYIIPNWIYYPQLEI